MCFHDIVKLPQTMNLFNMTKLENIPLDTTKLAIISIQTSLAVKNRRRSHRRDPHRDHRHSRNHDTNHR